MSSVIDEIRKARINSLTDEQKEGLLKHIKSALVHSSEAIIKGARHFCNQEWLKDANGYYKAPYDMHPAIEEWLHTLGFHTSRYYNKGGVEQGMSVWI